MRLTIDPGDSDCLFFCKPRKSYIVAELFPQNMCMLAFHAIYPYYLTLINGGWFSWVKPKDGVIVQCPNPEGALEMKVFLCDSKKEVYVEVLRTRGKCPKKHKEGNVFILAPDTFKFCPRALGAFIPYFKLIAESKKLPWTNKGDKTVLPCPFIACGNARFTVEKI